VTEMVTVRVNGEEVRVAAGTTVAAAISMGGRRAFRTSVKGEARGPLCGMGICFECRAQIDGTPHERTCQTVCRAGMEVVTDGG
jgi:predicted molibdopterin-dependent oxidoreductase YjgC